MQIAGKKKIKKKSLLSMRENLKKGPVKPFIKSLNEYKSSFCHCNTQNGCKLIFFL